MMGGSKVILAIESAIGGGSLSLASDGRQVDAWVGEGGLSRAEDLLPNIDLLLKGNTINKAEITQIVVSVGPGSFTGIRIGLATAMGLASALNIELAKFSILHAMTTGVSVSEGVKSIIAAVPVGRGVICTQRFRSSADSIIAIDGPTAISAEGFNTEELSLNNDLLTPENFPQGLANCLIAAVIHGKIHQADEPLFIAKPANI